MKTICFIALMLLMLTSCTTKTGENGQKVTFGIYETVYPPDLPASLSDSLSAGHIRIATEAKQPIIGYLKADSSAFLKDFETNHYRLLSTVYTVDKDSLYHAVVAIKPEAVINLSHIKKTKAEGNRVTLYFNMQGANLWAEITRNNIGKVVAFVIDNKIYDMPVINSEIRLGLAAISNLKNEASAASISGALNSSIPHFR